MFKKFTRNYISLPAWSQKVFFPGSDLEKMAAFWFSMESGTKLLARIRSGFLLKEMLERFTMKKDSKLSPNRKLWIYSAHDTTVAGLLNTLGLFEVNACFIQIKINFHLVAYDHKISYIN